MALARIYPMRFVVRVLRFSKSAFLTFLGPSMFFIQDLSMDFIDAMGSLILETLYITSKCLLNFYSQLVVANY